MSPFCVAPEMFCLAWKLSHAVVEPLFDRSVDRLVDHLRQLYICAARVGYGDTVVAISGEAQALPGKARSKECVA